MKEKTTELSTKNIFQKHPLLVLIILLIIIVVFITILLLNNKGVGSGGISKKEFDKIIIGSTTIYDLADIIDPDDKWNDDKIYDKCVEKIGESKEDHKYTYTYKYYGEKGGYAIITLQADYSNGYFYNDVIVIKKENHGLK